MIYRLLPLREIERKPWEMLYIGFIYSITSMLAIKLIFSKDFVLRDYSSILSLVIALICCFPYVYQIIKKEEGKDLEINEEGKLIKEHISAIKILTFLFIGLVVGFSFFYLIYPSEASKNFEAQIKTFCSINSEDNYNECLYRYGLSTGASTNAGHFFGILSNNIGVLIFTLFFSLFLGAGAMFILIWNASVIGAAIGMYSGTLVNIHTGLIRYMIHGIPEISAYFFGALAGGIISTAIIRKDLRGERLWIILEDAIVLVIIAVLILIIAALIEVNITPIII